MQVLGRPFGDATVLRVGYAYEQATNWHQRHPPLIAGRTAPVLTPPPVLSGTADQANAKTRDLCAYAAERAGLTLNDEHFAQLLEGAPYALEMVRRLRRNHGYADEPASIFSLPSSL
jgi:aspartyl-tRNA(Asn)/glutamyl-tRNA(Gln) amidotransferase subunit A